MGESLPSEVLVRLRSGAGARTARWRCGWGLTLLELLLGLAILGVLVSLGYPAYQEYYQRIRIGKAVSDIRRLEQVIETFHLTHDRLPDDLAEIGGGGNDPWGNPYAYLNIETTKGKGKVRKDHNLVPLNTDYDLYSKGPDGRSQSPLTAKHSRDDIVRAGNGRFVGPATDY